jgi:predicted lysophospholipase L1 biosynthesis ABC-type transport system permease subunit
MEIVAHQFKDHALVPVVDKRITQFNGMNVARIGVETL